MAAKRESHAGTDVTLVGGENLPDLPGSRDVPELLAEVVQVEGSADATQERTSLTLWAFQSDQSPHAVAADQLPHLLTQPSTFIWIDASGYSETTLFPIESALHLHRTTMHSMHSSWHRPWLSVHENYFFISATVPRLDADAWQIHASELDVCIGPNYLLSAHKLPLPFQARIQARALQSADLVLLDPTFLLYVILDELLAYFEDLNRHLQNESELLEERALRDVSETFLEDLLRFKRYAFALTGLVEQHREVFAAFFRPDFTWIAGEDVEGYYRDLQSRLVHVLSMLAAAKEAVNGAFNIYVSQMSHRTNQIIKVLTMVSTVLLPATLLTSLFGSTVRGLVPQLGVFWFIAMILSIGVISGMILWVFFQRNWLTVRPRTIKLPHEMD